MTRTMWNTDHAEGCAVSCCSIEPLTRHGPGWAGLQRFEESVFGSTTANFDQYWLYDSPNAPKTARCDGQFSVLAPFIPRLAVVWPVRNFKTVVGEWGLLVNLLFMGCQEEGDWQQTHSV